MSAGTRLQVEEVRERCDEALAAADLAEISAAALGSEEPVVSLVRRFDVRPESQLPMVALRDLVVKQLDVDADDGRVERFALLTAIRANLDQVAGAPVSAGVRQLVLSTFDVLIAPDTKLSEKLRVGHPWFVSACKLATLRRFPAGDFEWEISGIPGSLLVKVDRRKLPRLAYLLLVQMRGRAPVMATHVAITREGHLDPDAVSRAYHRMARSIELQPAVRGLMSASWMRSPSLSVASPHLRWMSDFFNENGGFVSDAGDVDPGCGVLARSSTRQRLHAEGKFRPKMGLAIWPRRAMIRWADAHPEFAD